MPQLAAHIRPESIMLPQWESIIISGLLLYARITTLQTNVFISKEWRLLLQMYVHLLDIKGCRRHNRRSLHTYSVISLCLHIYPSQRHTAYFIFPSRFPPTYVSQGWIHAFAFVDTLQQSWAPPREEAPQWLGHPRPINEAGEAEVAATFNVKEGERESPEAARAGRHWTERPPSCYCVHQNPSWCSTNKFGVTCSVHCSFTHKQHNHSYKEFLIQPGLPDSQQGRDRASILAASQGGEIDF